MVLQQKNIRTYAQNMKHFIDDPVELNLNFPPKINFTLMLTSNSTYIRVDDPLKLKLT